MLNHGPDGTILAVSAGDGLGYPITWPAIWIIDPETGDSDILIELEGATPHHHAISAAAVGDDLVFVAEGELWLLEDAFTADDP